MTNQFIVIDSNNNITIEESEYRLPTSTSSLIKTVQCNTIIRIDGTGKITVLKHRGEVVRND
jgi:hypothetical protein